MGKLILIALTVLLALPNLFDVDLNNTPYYTPPYDQKEKYDPSLGHINSIDKLEKYVDATAQQQGIAIGSMAYILAMEDAIEKRFYHGFSHLTTYENWIAAVGEKLFGFGLSCKVLPEAIMQNANAACSQQSMIMMELLKRKQLPYRKVGFLHHFALEVQVNNNWYYFDPNMEPNMTEAQRNAASWKYAADNLKQYYDTQRFTDLDYKFGVHQQATIGAVNEKQAANAGLFQKATGVLSKTIWLLPFCWLIFGYRRKTSVAKSKRIGLLDNLKLYFRSFSLQKA